MKPGGEISDPPFSLENVKSWKNRCLPDAQAIVARQWFLRAEEEYAQILNSEICDLESRLGLELESYWTEMFNLKPQLSLTNDSSTEVALAALLPALDVYRVALAPHKILPVDLLREIFIHCVGANNSSDSHSDLNSLWSSLPPCPQVICHVCSLWRSVALDTRELWTGIKFTVSRFNIGRVLNAFDFWVSRSGDYTLSLSIDAQIDDSRIDQLIAQYSRRCHSLVLSSYPAVKSFLELPPGSINILESLTLKHYQNHMATTLTEYTVFDGAPCIRSVSIYGYPGYKDLQSLGIPWHQITHLDLDSSFRVTASECYHILTRCIALSTATILISTDDDVQLAGHDISLPKLQTLELAIGSLANTARFFSRLSLPALKDLTLAHSDVPDGEIPEVPSFFSALNRFSLFGARIRGRHNPTLVAWLRACNSAVEVFLPDSVLTSAFDEISEGSLLPNVRLLTLYSAEENEIIAMLQARRNSYPSSVISEVGLTGQTWRLSVEEVRSIQDLMAAGIYLSAHDRWRAGNSRRRWKPNCGEIEKQARSDLAAQRGPFAQKELGTWLKASLELGSTSQLTHKARFLL
ncbi:hypothetical protein B0H11DRAFT_2293632 [Mycena galericulata]|nr:hypothetical protein B0H11DRAFT_2293632 [Mycena galericulata]